MAKYDNLSFQDVKNATHEEKVNILQVLTKRANVRMSALENEGIDTKATKKAHKFLDKQDRERFYQGKKYKTKREVDTALRNVLGFLNDETSLMPKRLPNGEKKPRRANTPIYSFDQISGASYDKKLKIAQSQAKLANRRMRDLEKADFTGGAYKVAVHDLGGKKRFYTGKEFKSEKQLDVLLRNLDYFLHRESSTVRGNNAINMRRIETLRRNGVDIPKGQEKHFIEFLKNGQFTELSKTLDSEQVLDDFADALNYIVQDITTMDEIQKQYEQYINDTDGKTFDVYRRERDAIFKNRKEEKERKLLK